jgi:hypothetical protein
MSLDDVRNQHPDILGGKCICLIFKFTTHATNRPTRLNSLPSFPSLWTTFPFKLFLSHVNVFFSSAVETDTKKRNWITPALMEVLQMLKFLLKKQRLDFMGSWMMGESELLEETR